jgi:hypothetical protein
MKSLFGKLFKKNRRKFERFILKEVSPVFVDPKISGEGARINDLSLGGLSIDYSEGEKRLGKVFEVDILASDGFRLNPVSVENVSDSRVRAEAGRRRVRGRFRELSQVQKIKLQTFLEGYEKKFSDAT